MQASNDITIIEVTAWHVLVISITMPCSPLNAGKFSHSYTCSVLVHGKIFLHSVPNNSHNTQVYKMMDGMQ